MAEQQACRPAPLRHCRTGGDNVPDIGSEAGLMKLAIAFADAGKVEAQHANALPGKRAGDADRGEIVLPAGKAMGEQGPAADPARWRFEAAGQNPALAARKFERVDHCGGGLSTAPPGMHGLLRFAPDLRKLGAGASLPDKKEIICLSESRSRFTRRTRIT
jgi:hypothetical protein